MSPVSMFQCWDLIDLLLTSAGAGQSPSSPSTASTNSASNGSNTGLARFGETAQVVDALAAFQCSVADLEIEISSVKISFSSLMVRNYLEILLADVRAGTCCYSVTQTQRFHGLTVSLCVSKTKSKKPGKE